MGTHYHSSTGGDFGNVETATANEVEPLAHLKQIFTELPNATKLEVLLPLNIDTDQFPAYIK